MEILDKAGKKVRKGVDFTREILKLRNEIHICEDVASRNYMEIGRSYCEAHRGDDTDPYAKQIRAITNAERGAGELKDKLGRMIRRK